MSPPNATETSARGRDISQRVGFRKVLEEIANQYHCRISCKYMFGNPIAPAVNANADVVVRVWSTPVGTERRTCAQVFGHDLPDGTRDALAPMHGFETLVDSNGVPYAQVIPASGSVPAHVYVLFNIFHQSFYGLTTLMREVFGNAIPYALAMAKPGVAADTALLLPTLPVMLALPSAPLSGAQEEGRQYRWQNERGVARDIAVRAASDAFAAPLTAHGDAVRQGRDQLRSLADAFGPTAQAFEAIDRRSDRSHELAIAALAEEYDRIAKMPVVEHVEITDRELVVHTRALTVTEDNVTYDIGCWAIHIPRNGIDVRMHRQSKVMHQGWQHPHVDGEGKICWGNVQEELTRSLRDAEFDVAVAYLLSLLGTGKGQQSDWTFHMDVLRNIGRVVSGNGGTA